MCIKSPFNKLIFFLKTPNPSKTKINIHILNPKTTKQHYLFKKHKNSSKFYKPSFLNTNYDNNKIIALMGCTPTKKETPPIAKQTQVIDSFIQPPEIDNQTDFYSS